MIPSLSKLALLAAAVAASPGVHAAPAEGRWLGEELPLPLAVRTAQDLAVKAAAEKQYLIFNLLARGKLAWDAGDYATAATKWESLLRLPGLDPQLDAAVRPLAVEARTRAGGTSSLPPAPSHAAAAASAPSLPAAAEPGRRSTMVVQGTVSGGGPAGPGGTVVWLKRADGPTPRPSPARGKSINQLNKT